MVDVLEIDEYAEKERRVFKSSLNAINELYDGEPYASDLVFAVYGLPNVGKTLLMLQEAAWLESQGYNVLYIDTEGSVTTTARRWLPVFRARFKPSKKRGRIYAVVLKTVESYAEFFGWKIKLDLKGGKQKDKGAKMELSFIDREREDRIEAWRVMRGKKIDFVIVDSITMPIRTRVPSSPQNLVVKSDLEGFMLGQLMYAQDLFGVGVIATFHASINPTNPYDTSADIRGGLAVKHTAKHIMYIEWRQKKELRSIRQFWLVRKPDAEPWSMVRFTRIDDMGYHDLAVSNDKLGELLTGSQLKRLGGGSR